MNTERLKHVLLMLLTSISAFAYNVTEADAIHVVEEYRALVDDPGKYYVAETDTIVNNWRCPVDTLPEEDWANGDYPMWLVFVDEQPNNSMWSHPCKYYYVPKQFDSPLHIPVICYEGLFMAETTMSHRRIAQNTSNNLNYYSIPSNILPQISDSHNNDFSDKLVVLYIGGEYDEVNSPNFYHDAVYMYRVLRKQYNIPKTQIKMLYGIGDTNTNMVDSCETLIPINRDLDDDGISDIIGGITADGIWEVFENIKTTINPDQHLLVIFDVHGDMNGNLLLLDGYKLNTHQLNDYLNAIKCASQCILINSCYSGKFINPLNKKGRVIITSSRSDEMSFGNKQEYNFFIHKWTNAINNYSVRGFECDIDNNGLISFKDAYDYACLDTYEYHEYHEILDLVSHPNPRYLSTPSGLGNSIEINQLPQLSGDLHIRDTEDDWGESGNSNIECAWESPDIWIRNNNDGVTNQFSEPIIVTQNDSTVYVYTRINNNGYNTFEANQRWLHLQWDYPSLRHDSIAWSSHDIPVALTEPIDTMSSQIITYEWHLPSELRYYAQMNSGRLNIDLLARISDTNEFAGQEFDAWYPFEYSSLKNVATNPKMAQKCVYHNEDYNKPLMVKTNISLNTGETTLRISPLQGGFGMHEVYYVINETDTLRPTTDTPDVLLSNLQSHNQITIYCKTNVPRSQTLSTTDIPIALYDINGTLLGGCTLRMKIAGHGFIDPLEPGIGDSGEIDDGGEIGGPIFGGRTLSMTNVSEPVSCEWTDSHGNVLGNNEYLCIAMNAIGEYTLTVKSLLDGEVASVSKEILPVSFIKNLASYDGNISVSLQYPSIQGMALEVRSVVNESISQRHDLLDGLSEYVLNTSALDAGVYLVSLYYNNQLLETKQVIK